jgi:hypothetical protein
VAVLYSKAGLMWVWIFSDFIYVYLFDLREHCEFIWYILLGQITKYIYICYYLNLDSASSPKQQFAGFTWPRPQHTIYHTRVVQLTITPPKMFIQILAQYLLTKYRDNFIMKIATL